MPRFSREELRFKFQKMVRDRQPIVGGGAGTGLSAKCEEAGGIEDPRSDPRGAELAALAGKLKQIASSFDVEVQAA